jgi:hypothetical protein
MENAATNTDTACNVSKLNHDDCQVLKVRVATYRCCPCDTCGVLTCVLFVLFFFLCVIFFPRLPGTETCHGFAKPTTKQFNGTVVAVALQQMSKLDPTKNKRFVSSFGKGQYIG